MEYTIVAKLQKGPPEAKIKYTIKPTTTGGIPIKEFSKTSKIFFKKNYKVLKNNQSKNLKLRQ